MKSLLGIAPPLSFAPSERRTARVATLGTATVRAPPHAPPAGTSQELRSSAVNCATVSFPPVNATRRRVCGLLLAGAALPIAAIGEDTGPSHLPREVAGIPLPTSPSAVRAAEFVRQAYPRFLFNHCMRTFLFGALELRRQRVTYNAEDAFIAAAFHDMGLLPNFSSPSQSFEVDGANAAEKFALDAALSRGDAGVVWQSIALHDTRRALIGRAGPEAVLVSLGAGSDVDGPSLDTDDERREMEQVVTAFPRLQFKRQFSNLLIEHCKRKPTSQQQTWLEGLCRSTTPEASAYVSVESEINAAPFAE